MEGVEDLLNHDGTVGAGWGFAGGDDFGDGVGVLGGVVLLVFLGKLARVAAAVTDTAAMRGWAGGFWLGHKGDGGLFLEYLQFWREICYLEGMTLVRP